MILIELFYFLFLVLFAFYIPGNVVLRLSKIDNKSFLINSVLSTTIGICMFTFSIYTLSWINLEALYNIFLVATLVYYLKNFKKPIRPKFKEYPLLELIIIALGTIFMTYIMWRSGSIENNNLVFYGVNKIDAIYHLSIIGNLKFDFPPTHPGISEFPLRGYNFFYDLILANFSKFYNLQIIDLYFRYFPLFLAIFYGFSGWALGKFMGMKKTTIIFFLFLIYFTQGMSEVFLPNYLWDSGVVQTIANIVDPSVILSICLLFSFYILIFSKRSNSLILISILVIGVLPMIKIYTGFLAFGSIGILMIFSILRKKDFYYLKLIIPALIITAFTYLPFNFGSGKLVLAPALLYRHYLESISDSQNLNWFMRLQVFEEYNNYPKIFLYKIALVLPLFYLPSLGIRLINLLFFKKLFSKSFYSEKNLFWIILIVLGFIIPSLFIQSTAVFVVLQFLWIAYFILLIPTAYSLTIIFDKLGKVLFVFIFVFIIALMIPNNISLIKTYSFNPTKINMDMYELTNEIKKIPQDDGVLVLNSLREGEAYKPDYIIPMISALSSHHVFYEPEIMEFYNTSYQMENRSRIVGDLRDKIKSCDNPSELSEVIRREMKKTKNTYIVSLNKYECFDKLKSVEFIFENSSYSIYKIL